MTQYTNEYGTTYAVREHKGSPALTCRAKDAPDWSLSGVLAAVQGDAQTADDMQWVLDKYARTHGWKAVNGPSKTCLCETCTCTGCHEDCFGHCKGCGHPVDHCNSYQTEGEKRLRAEPVSVEPPETADEGGEPEDGFPDWVRPVVEAFLQFDFVRELPAFTTAAFKNSEPVRHHWGGSLADGLYDTGPKGIKFSVFRGPNSDQYREASYTWAGFVRRCKAEELEPEPLRQDKEATPCNTEPTAPTGDAAATTDASAAPQPSQAAGTSTGSPGNSADASSCPSAEPAPDTAPTSLPAFDYGGLDADTAEKLRGITERVMELSQTYAWGMAYQVGRAHDLLCGNGACETVSQAHKRNNQHSENTFTAWCAYIGVERRSAYNLLNAYRLICKATPEQQKNLQLAPAKLLYVAGKKDTPDQLANAVLDGDITSHKQYQEALAEIRARDAKINDLLEMSEAADRRAEEEQRKRKEADEARIAAENKVQQYREIKDAALETAKQQREKAASADARARAAENRADGAQKLAEQRGSENTELKAKIRELENQPRDVAVVQPGEDQIEAWRREGADRMAAAMRDTVRQANQEKLQAQNQVADLQEQLATARPDADACQRTVDTLYETAENLRMLLRTQLKQAQLSPTDYGKVVAHVLQVARTLLDTVRVCAPAGYTMDDDEEDFL